MNDNLKSALCALVIIYLFAIGTGSFFYVTTKNKKPMIIHKDCLDGNKNKKIK